MPRAASPPTRCAPRAAALVGAEPWGRTQWERLAEGQLFDGMESWLPWLVEDDRRAARPRSAPTARVVLVEPRRMRDRAGRAERRGGGPGRRAGRHLGRGHDHGTGARPATPAAGTPSPAARPLRPAARTLPRLRCCAVVPVADVARPPRPSTAQGLEPVHGDRARLARPGSAELAGGGYSVTVCAEGAGSADPPGRRCSPRRACRPRRRHEARRRPRWETDVGPPGRPRAWWPPRTAGSSCPAPRWPCWPRPTSPGAAGPTGRPGARARPTDGFFDDLAPGDYVVHRQHGVARYGGMVTRTVNGASRDYLLLEYRGDDKLYLPSDQIDVLTPYSGGESPSLNRLGGSEWQRDPGQGACRRARDRRGARRALPPAPAGARATPSPPDTPWQRELEDSFAYVETADQARAVEEVKADMEAERPWTAWCAATSGFGKTEVAVRAAFKAVQDGKQVAVLVPTTLLAPAARPDLRRALRRVPGARRDAVAGSSPRPRRARWWPGIADGERWTWSSAPTAARRRRRVQGPRPARGGRGAALRRHPQGGHQAAGRPASTCSRSRRTRSRGPWRWRSPASATCR